MSSSADITQTLAERFGLKAQPCWEDGAKEALASVCCAHQVDIATATVLLSKDPELLRQHVSHFTVSESHFMRHHRQLDLLAHSCKRQIDRGADKLAIWSAGCCRGEEAFSVLIAAASFLTATEHRKLQVMANDIDGKAIAVARDGIYEPWSFRGVAPDILRRFFESEEGGRHRVVKRLRDRVTFVAMSIDQQLSRIAADSIDAILFRNVGIYLTDAHLTQTYQGFARVLRDEGMLLVAPTDPPPPRSLFAVKEPGSGSYRVRGDSCEDIITATAAKLANVPPRTVADAQSQTTPSTSELLERARALADARQHEQALLLLDKVAFRDPLAAGCLLVRGQIHLELGNFEKAVSVLYRAVTLQPKKVVVRYWYALALKTTGQFPSALAELAAVRQRLVGAEPDEVLEDSDATVSDLLSAISETEREMT